MMQHAVRHAQEGPGPKGRTDLIDPSKQAFEKIVAVFTKALWSDDPTTVVKSLDAAVRFFGSAHAPPTTALSSGMGLHAITVGVMNRHVDHVKIQIRCIFLLISMLRLGVCDREKLRCLNGLRSVLVGMDNFPDNATLQSNGCVFLFEYFKGTGPDDFVEFLDLNAPALLMDTIATHPTVPALQHSACGVIGDMARQCQKSCAVFIGLGGIVQVAQTIQNFPDSLDIQQVACATMTTLMNPTSIVTLKA